MKRKGLSLLAALALLWLLFASCAVQETDSIGNEKTAPLDRISEALATGSTAAYESAFPPDFCASYRALFPDLSETVAALLAAADAYNCSTCGEDCRLRYELTGSEPYALSQLEELFSFEKLDRFLYTMPLAGITAAEQIRVSVHWSGSYGQSACEVSYLVLCIGGVWYLHPQYFGTVLRS